VIEYTRLLPRVMRGLEQPSAGSILALSGPAKVKSLRQFHDTARNFGRALALSIVGAIGFDRTRRDAEGIQRGRG